MSDPAVTPPAGALSGPEGSRWGWALLLTVPCILALDIPLYARRAPLLDGIPFFIWFQFVIVAAGAVFTGVVFHFQTRGRSDTEMVTVFEDPVAEVAIPGIGDPSGEFPGGLYAEGGGGGERS